MDAWFDEEFFQTGAFLRLDSGKILFGKGGGSKLIERLPQKLSEGHFYVKSFFNNQIREYSPREFHLFEKSAFSNLLRQEMAIESAGNSDELYAQDFLSLKKTFGPNLKKAVLISREAFNSPTPSKSLNQVLINALASEAGESYGLWESGAGIIGVTPEILFDLQNNTLSSFALAGTDKSGNEEKLIHSRKDLHEHELVVQNITEVLSPFAAEINTGFIKIHPYRHLIHLRTDIQAKLKSDFVLSDILDSLSPTAALGGYPKEEALLFLKTTQYAKKFPDRIYGSTMGATHDGKIRFAVMIRNVQWKDDTFFIESGGGVVPESTLENETQEIRLKRNTCTEILFH